MRSSFSAVPFSEQQQLCHLLSRDRNRLNRTDGRGPWLPGQPLIELEDNKSVLEHLDQELLTPLLNKMSPHLWLVATPSSAHISALHRQRVRGRDIVICEDPEMHLVWIRNRCYVKPLPTYLLSYAFWAHYFFPDKELSDAECLHRQNLFRAACGYLRSYHYLVQHESDYHELIAYRLLPDDIPYEDFRHFIGAFGRIGDDQVSPRYHFGELRLTRLNMWAKVFLGQWQFRKVAWQYSDYFARYYAPILFVFAVLSVVLDGMQAGMQARPSWDAFASASAWFTVVVMCSVLGILVFFVIMFAVMSSREIIFAVGKKLQKPALDSPVVPLQNGLPLEQGYSKSGEATEV